MTHFTPDTNNSIANRFVALVTSRGVLIIIMMRGLGNPLSILRACGLFRYWPVTQSVCTEVSCNACAVFSRVCRALADLIWIWQVCLGWVSFSPGCSCIYLGGCCNALQHATDWSVVSLRQACSDRFIKWRGWMEVRGREWREQRVTGCIAAARVSCIQLKWNMPVPF